MAPDRRFMLKVLSLFDVRGMDSEMIRNILKFDMDTIHQLSSEGWIYDGPVIRLHPVISETVRNWSWDDIPLSDTGSLSDFCMMNDGTTIPYDITVMKYHKAVCDIYVSCDNEVQLKAIGKEAENYTRIHPRHIPTANCLFFHNDMKNAGKMLEYAIEICRDHPDELRYIDKLIDLKIFQLDVFIELNDSNKCRELIDEISRMNEAYRDQGIFREISQDTKEKLTELLDKAN